MKLCVVSFKECWQDEAGNWLSDGGFPLQMEALGSLFDQTTLVIVAGQFKSGGLLLPKCARVVPLRKPAGGYTHRRKLAVMAHLPYYLGKITQNIRQADIVHTPVPGDMPLLAMLAAIVMRKRLLVRYCDSWVTNSVTTLTNKITRACMRRFAGGLNVMLVTGDGPEPPAPGIHWVFATSLTERELATIQPDLCRSLHDPARLVFIGRLSKGVSNLIKAMGLLKARTSLHPLPQVTLIGDGLERCELEELAVSQDCSDCIRFTGRLDREELSCQLQEMDFCVQPSLTDGFSKAWLDAMAHGLPVLASEVGAARTAIGSDSDRGWLVPPGDVPALADALLRVLTTPLDWPALRHRCRAYVEELTLELWARQIGEICAQQWGLSLVEGRLSG